MIRVQVIRESGHQGTVTNDSSGAADSAGLAALRLTDLNAEMSVTSASGRVAFVI